MELYQAIFNSLEQQIALIDSSGNIIDVNNAWLQFGQSNGLAQNYQSIGHNYLDILTSAKGAGDLFAEEAITGFKAVLSGQKSEFYYQYPCHSPDKRRWFTMRICRLSGDTNNDRFVVSHHNITKQKLIEEKLEDLAMHDPLTGLHNRRAFRDFLSREVRISIREQLPLSLLLIDVDYFKHFNDRFGHAAGDECLIQVSQVLLSHTRRPGDIAARFGGDEFALIMGNTDSDNAVTVANSIIKKTADLNLSIDKLSKATVSIGLLSLIPVQGQSIDFVFKEADKALYKAKELGRNQLFVATADNTQTSESDKPQSSHSLN